MENSNNPAGFSAPLTTMNNSPLPAQHVIRYAQNDIPHRMPTVVGNQAVDGRTETACQGTMICFDSPHPGRNINQAGGIQRMCPDDIPHWEPTFNHNRAMDWRDPRAYGHSALVGVSSRQVAVGLNVLTAAETNFRQACPDDAEFLWDGETLAFMEAGKKVRLANFCCSVSEKYILVGAHDETEMLRVQYERASGERVMLDIPLAKFVEANYVTLIRKYPEFRLYPDSGRHIQLYRLYCSERYDASNGLAWKTFYSMPGWHTANGIAHYYSALDDHCQTSRMLAALDGVDYRQLAEYVSAMQTVARPQIMIPTLLAMHYGPTKALFEEAGYREDFATLYIAPSGSGKSFLARAFFTYQGGDFINFEATSRAIDLELENRVDAVCVVDDMKAGRDKKLTAQVDHILRQIGDATGRKKSVNGGKEQEQAKVRCAVVITAENDLDELQPSGRFRTLALFIEPGELTSSNLLRQYRDDIVQAHQRGKQAALDYYMTAYIRFLEQQYPRIVDAISSTDIPTPLGLQARQATIFQILAKQASIVLRFWIWCGLLSEPEAKNTMQNKWLPALVDVLLVNDQRGKIMDPVALFLRAIAEGIASQRLPIADTKEAFESSGGKLVGFWDHKILKLLPDAAFDFVVHYYECIGIQFAETQNGMLNRFYEKGGILDVYAQKDHKAKLLKSVKIRNVKTPIMCLNWPRVEQFLAEMEPMSTITTKID